MYQHYALKTQIYFFFSYLVVFINEPESINCIWALLNSDTHLQHFDEMYLNFKM